MRHEGNCAKCEIYRWSLDRDHIYPKWKAMRDGWSEDQIEDLSNIQYLCQNCHYDKSIEDRKGYKQSSEQIAKRVAAHLGATRSEESKQRMSTAQNRPETKAKLRAAHVGIPKSEEARTRMSIAQSLRTSPSAETCEKMRISQRKRFDRESAWIEAYKSGERDYSDWLKKYESITN